MGISEIACYPANCDLEGTSDSGSPDAAVSGDSAVEGRRRRSGAKKEMEEREWLETLAEE